MCILLIVFNQKAQSGFMSLHHHKMDQTFSWALKSNWLLYSCFHKVAETKAPTSRFREVSLYSAIQHCLSYYSPVHTLMAYLSCTISHAYRENNRAADHWPIMIVLSREIGSTSEHLLRESPLYVYLSQFGKVLAPFSLIKKILPKTCIFSIII